MSSGNNEGTPRASGPVTRQSSQIALDGSGGQITQQQAGALARALTKELESAKAAGDNIELSRAHYAKAESIKKILVNYRQQQKAQLEHSSPISSPLPTTGRSASSSDLPLEMAEASASNASANPQGKVKIIEKLNQVKKSLELLELNIKRLEAERAQEEDASKVAKFDEDIQKLRLRVNDFQKISHYLKNIVAQGKSNSSSPSPPIQKQPSPDYPDRPITRAQMTTTAPKPAFSIGSGGQPYKSASPSAQKPLMNPSYSTTSMSNYNSSNKTVNLGSLLANKAAVISKLGPGGMRPTYSSTMGSAYGVPAPKALYDNPNVTPLNIPDNGGRVLTKRRLQELTNSLAATEGDVKPTVDNEVEELLLDLADEFVESVTTFACRLAKHRKVTKVDIRDFQLHLERNWNIRVPGYTMEDAKAPRKLQPTAEYTEKVAETGSKQ